LKNEVFWALKRHEGLEKIIMEGIYLYTRKEEEGGDQKRRWAQGITDEWQMSASDAGHLAYDRVVFRRVVKRAQF
jgi:hypothetical protein